MELDVLKVYAGSFISELDIDVEDKVALINFVKEADEYDIMALLTDGELPDEWSDDYLAALDEEMMVLDEQIFAMENVLMEAIGEKFKKAASAVGGAARKAGGGVKKGAGAAYGYSKKGASAVGRGAKKAAGATWSGAKKGAGGVKKGAMAGGRWAKEHPKTAIGIGAGVGALGAAAAYRSRKKRMAAKKAAEEK